MSDPFGPPRGPIATLALGLALLGGAAMLFVTALVTVSVGLRWVTGRPIQGDIELVQIGSGFAVMALLAYGTIMRTNILVDTFTTWLPARVNQLIDAFWTLVWAVAALVLAWRLGLGALEAIASRTTTIGLLGVPIWWAIAAGVVCFVATGLAALHWVWRLARGHD